jgi:serine-type D-Ala-D-Ala carboxypeptidase/endopeptidase (penicillin-binding protein 4)
MIRSTRTHRNFSHRLLSLFLALTFAAAPSLSQVRGAASSAARPQQTLAELESAIRERLARPEFRRGQVGVKIASLESGKVLFEQNAEKYFMPASNMKNFTVAAALEKLTPDHRFTTSVYTSSKPDSNGVIRGPLRVFGRGDVSISYTFNDGDRYKGMDRLVEAIVAAGVQRIEGDIIGDDTYFTGSPLPVGWEWDDLQFYYGAEVSALPVNDNVVSLSVTPGPIGYSCTVRMTPPFLVMRVANDCTTTASGAPRTLRIHKPLGRNIIEISGDLPLGNSGFNGFVSVSRPAEMFAALLKQRLENKGITVTGVGRAVIAGEPSISQTATEIAKLESPPLALIAANTMKPSQNMYTEVLLWSLGENLRASTPQTGPIPRASYQLGVEVVKNFMKEIGVAEDGILQSDGSGLSRHNLVTPSSVVALYTYMAKTSKHSRSWRDSLTIGAVDGTLRNRFAGTKAAANVRGKTGTINQVSALSGYVMTAGGEQLVFSLLVNGIPETRTRVGLIDEIVVLLADFNGKIDQ